MSNQAVLSQPKGKYDYSLTGLNATLAVEKGLAEADWYQCPVPRETMRSLLERRNGPAIRDTLLWFALILGSAAATYIFWGSAAAALAYFVYCTLYASTSDSRWHESGHGTAFKTDWMNNLLYEIASFMVMRESSVWRWSHTRHHSDTIVVGRDPEIAVPLPPSLLAVVMKFFNLRTYPLYFKSIVLHSFGRSSANERAYIPVTEFPAIYFKARIYIGIYVAVAALSLLTHSILPLMFIGLSNLFGAWLLPVYGLTQHAGLAENVLDHRLNCRTVYMGAIHRYLYWNMNYHVEHHMYPLVPYHALPRLHEVVKSDCPEPYQGLWSAWREIVPTVLRQRKDPAYHVKRKLPSPRAAQPGVSFAPDAAADADGWLEVCSATRLGTPDVLRFDYKKKTYALYRDEKGAFYASDGLCTHGNTHLSTGIVIGKTIECPKHNGRFHLVDGSPARAPICRSLATYAVEQRNGRLYVNLAHVLGAAAREEKRHRFRVISNRSVATFIKEPVLELIPDRNQSISDGFSFLPGDYLQIEIPLYEQIRYRDLDIPEPFATVWRNQHLFDLVASNPEAGRRNNYSLACNQRTEKGLRLNVRIATPPPGQDCAPGVGSSYVFSLKEGDVVTAIGPFGDFHIRPTQREMLYIGGGAGMAPLRAHISHLLETEQTARKMSFWYGARSKQEIFYADYFSSLAKTYRNFSFQLALSAPLPEDDWTGHTGFIHQVVLEKYLRQHRHPQSIEYYLCGPPLMIKACTRMLAELGISEHQIAYDEF